MSINFGNQNKITALQIHDAETTINEIIKKKVRQFNIGRIRQAYKNAKENFNVEKLSDEQKLTIKKSLISDEKSQQFIEKQKKLLRTEFENYQHIRSTINGINDMSFDAVAIEKTNLIQPQKFNKLVGISIFNNEQFLRLLRLQKLAIYSPSINKQDNIQTIIDGINKMNKLYKIPVNTPDIEIISEYGYETNIDIAHNLSDLIKIQKTSVFNQINKKQSHIKSNVTNMFLSYLFSDKITNNITTLFPTTLNSNINYQKVYRLRTLGELLLEISNPDYRYKSKSDREQLYINTDGTRPIETEYRKWNGLQVFDLDLKQWVYKEHGSIDSLKLLIHNSMIKYHWYLWIVKSASGNGLHIYTKVAPPHHQYTKAVDNETSSKYWYNVNYVTKLNIVYHTLNELNIKHDLFSYKNFDNLYVDNVVSRITAGIRLSYDENPYVNNNFIDMNLVWGLGQLGDVLNNDQIHQFENNYIDVSDKTQKLLKKKYKLIDDLYLEDSGQIEYNTDTTDKMKAVLATLSDHVKINTNFEEYKQFNVNQINYFTRYNICNTLASMMGVNGLTLAHEILKSAECNNVAEINAFYSCAISNNKQPTKLGIELLRKVGVIKSLSDEFKVEIQEGFKRDISIEIQKVLTNELPEIDYKLSENEYLSTVGDSLLQRVTGQKINILFAPAGSGKTMFITRLTKQGKRILLVLPYISVIQNKVEKDKSITDYFDIYYGSVSIKDLEYGRNAVTTFDKFSRVNFDKVSKMFDYIIIDESHLLFTSAYRIEATSNVIKKIKELFYISSNDDLSAKLLLMTGTETGESHFFDSVSNIIRISKKQPNKNMEFVLCDDTLDATTRLASYAADLLRNDYRLLIPTNKGEIYSEKIIGMVEHLLGENIKYGYYKRSNTEQEICQLINNDCTVGDYEIIFCSNYLSVGVDINDKDKKFASLYLGDFSGFEIEQFNARIRKKGIESKFFVITETANGDINNTLIDEPTLILKVTDNDKLFFIDDKSIANAKQEFIAEYDPVLKKIVTPGFSLLNGKIQFNLEEYELISFEDKYISCMIHPVKVARELAKYGYNITISTRYDELTDGLKEILKQTGIESAKAEKIRKHQLVYHTFIDLINNNQYVNQYGLEYNNVINWISTAIRENKLIEDRSATKHIEVIFDAFAAPQKVIVKSKEALEKILGYARYLIKRYSSGKCIEIFEKYVDDNGVIKFKNFKRAINLLKLMDSEADNELSQPISKTIEKIYAFVDEFEIDDDKYIGYNAYQAKLDMWTQEYIEMLGITINTRHGYDKIRDSIVELLMDISTKRTSKNGIKFSYNKLPDTNSDTILNKRSIDSLIHTIFKVSDHNTNNPIRQKHIVLTEQNF